MLRPVRLTISVLLLGSGAIPLLNAASGADAELAGTFSRTSMVGKFAGDDEGAGADLARTFSQTVRPFVTSYCAGCHSGPTPAAGFDLQRYTTMESVVDDFGHWALVLRKLTAKEMPPRPMKQIGRAHV